MFQFTIKRSEWYRGKQFGSMLLRKDGQKCCLGFFGKALGAKDEQLLEKYNPGYCSDVFWPEWFHFHNDQFLLLSSDLTDLIHINDSVNISDSEREKRITEIFAKHNIQIEFVD